MERSKTNISLAEAAETLGVHYMTAYRYVRTGRLPAHKVGQEWRVALADVEALRDRPPAAVPISGRGRRRDRTAVLVDRLTHSDEQGAWAIIDDAVNGGMDPDRVYLDLLAPALEDVGDRWALGEVTIAQEHQASALVLRLIGRLGPRFARRGRKRGTLVVGAPSGDVHGLPSALLSDLMRGRRFDVIDLGADAPAESWASTSRETVRLVGIGMCASTPGSDEVIAATLAEIRAETAAPIVLGGNGIVDEAHAFRLGASAFSGSFEDAVDALDRLSALALPDDLQPPSPRTAS